MTSEQKRRDNAQALRLLAIYLAGSPPGEGECDLRVRFVDGGFQAWWEAVPAVGVGPQAIVDAAK